MARNTMALTTGSSAESKLIGLLVLAALLTFVVKDPVNAAVWVRALAGLAGDVIDGISMFLQAVVNH